MKWPYEVSSNPPLLSYFQMGVFHRVRVAEERMLRADKNFWPFHGEFISSNPRGFGYWVWKSYLINKTEPR